MLLLLKCCKRRCLVVVTADAGIAVYFSRLIHFSVFAPPPLQVAYFLLQEMRFPTPP